MAQRQLENKIAKEIIKFYVTTLNYGPKGAKCCLIDNMVLIGFKGHLLLIEKEILKLTDKEKAVDLIKNTRRVIHQITKKQLSQMIEKNTSLKVISYHSDISTVTGERIEVFVLNENLEKKLKGG